MCVCVTLKLCYVHLYSELQWAVCLCVCVCVYWGVCVCVKPGGLSSRRTILRWRTPCWLRLNLFYTPHTYVHNISQTLTHNAWAPVFHISELNAHTHANLHNSPSFLHTSHTHRHTEGVRWWFVAVTSTCGPIASVGCHAVLSHCTDNGKVEGRVWGRGCRGAFRHFGKLANVPREGGRGRGVTHRHDIIESPREEAGGEGEDRDSPPGWKECLCGCKRIYSTIFF